MKKLRLVKVIVQPVFMADDGINLEEVAPEPVVVLGSEWEGYATGQFVEATAALEARLNEA